MPTSLTLDTARSSGGQVMLVAAGEIDLSNIDAFDRALTAATAESVGIDEPFLVDLSAVEYLDSSAINALAAHADRIRLIAHHLLMPILRISGLAELTTIESAAPTASA
jgi:anti-anti-sigma factor